MDKKIFYQIPIRNILIINSQDEYLSLFEKKRKLFYEEFKNSSKIDYFKSPHQEFRYRAEFSLIKSGDKKMYAMNIDGKKIAIDIFPIASGQIQELMSSLIKYINRSSAISEKLFQVEFQSSRNNEAMIGLIYHKELDSEWKKEAELIHRELKISIIGRSKNQTVIIGKNYVTETYKYLDNYFDLRLFEQCFSQTNPFICDDILGWVCKSSAKKSNDIMELHCGVGTFTIPLSYLYGSVLATENSRPSIKGLKENILLNNCKNIFSARLSGKETFEAYYGARKFRRLQGIDLNNFNIETVFLDPPREGLDLFTIEKLQNIENIIYISCGFDSFKRDIRKLQRTHEVTNLAMFDQFPFTDHIESGAILKRKEPDY